MVIWVLLLHYSIFSSKAKYKIGQNIKQCNLPYLIFTEQYKVNREQILLYLNRIFVLCSFQSVILIYQIRAQFPLNNTLSSLPKCPAVVLSVFTESCNGSCFVRFVSVGHSIQIRYSSDLCVNPNIPSARDLEAWFRSVFLVCFLII